MTRSVYTMFPNATFLTIDLYTWMIILGVVVAVVIFRLLADKRKVSAKVFNFALAVGVCCVAVGYGSAVLFQAFYHWLDTGEWVWNAGATFYGGLIGAAVVFLAAYFGIGHFIFRDKKHITELTNVLNCIFPAIIAAHCFGRIGCLFAGCCYGKLTDSWMGITMWIPSAHAWQKRLPTQLFEAIFLAVLFAVVVYFVVRKRTEYAPSMYLVGYGVWRFVIEYVRDDAERGSSGISWLTPSQLTAIVLVVCGVALIFAYKYWLKGLIDNVEKQPEIN